MHVDVEVVETGRFARPHRALDRPRPPQPRRARLRAPAPGRRLRVPHRAPTSRSRAGWARARRPTSPGCWPRTRSSSSTPTSSPLATELEGHPDNVAAALLGGFVLCADGEATRFDPPAGLEAVLVVPRRALRTAKARAALPAGGADGRRRLQRRPREPARPRARPGPTSTSSRAGWRTGSTSRTAPRCTRESMALVERAREFGALGRDDLGRRARRCWSGACTTRRPGSWSGCGPRPRAGRRSGGCRSSRWARTCGRWTEPANCASRRRVRRGAPAAPSRAAAAP